MPLMPPPSTPWRHWQMLTPRATQLFPQNQGDGPELSITLLAGAQVNSVLHGTGR